MRRRYEVSKNKAFSDMKCGGDVWAYELEMWNGREWKYVMTGSYRGARESADRIANSTRIMAICYTE